MAECSPGFELRLIRRSSLSVHRLRVLRLQIAPSVDAAPFHLCHRYSRGSLSPRAKHARFRTDESTGALLTSALLCAGTLFFVARTMAAVNVYFETSAPVG